MGREEVESGGSFKGSCLKEEQNSWTVAGPGVQGDAPCVCCQWDWSRERQTLIFLCMRVGGHDHAQKEWL